MSQTLAQSPPRSSRWSQFYALTKPRVVQLIVFCALIGMLLAVPGLPEWRVTLAATGARRTRSGRPGGPHRLFAAGDRR